MKHASLFLALTALAVTLIGCSWAEVKQVCSDVVGLFDGTPAPPLPDGTPEPDGWGLINWSTGGAAGTVVAVLGWLFRRSLARNFGRAVDATKGLLKRP